MQRIISKFLEKHPELDFDPATLSIILADETGEPFIDVETEVINYLAEKYVRKHKGWE